ncbi:MAG TPA: CRISPR-associated endonuclease Cas1 [Bacilli bacterium]|nr:CRISPR-associated endonuclease Cas1 [Bacilli bacterium]
MKQRFYIYQSGELKRQDQSLVFITNKDEKIYIPIMQIELINVFSQIIVNSAAYALLNQYGITIHYFNYFGNYYGSFVPDVPKLGKTIINQVEHIINNEKRIVVAKEIILASAYNMRALLKYYHKKRSICKDQINLIDTLFESLEELNTEQLNDIMLIEARIKQIYYSCFDEIIFQNQFCFGRRSVRPPLNEVNAMMSFGYQMLYSLIESIIHRSSLVLHLPFIHSYERRKEGLQFDIADIFKPVVIDRTIFRLINRKQISKMHFENKNEGVYLNKLGGTIFIEELEAFMKTTISTNGSNRKYSYNQIISKEIHKLTNHINDKETYSGFRMRW